MIRIIIDQKPTSPSSRIDKIDYFKAIRKEIKSKNIEMMTGVLEMEVVFVHPRPKSFSDNPERHRKTSKPFLSNLLSNLQFAFLGILYPDSSHLSDIHLSKVYADLDENAHIDVTIRRLPYEIINETKYTVMGVGEHARTREERRANNIKAHQEEAEKRLIESRQLREERRIKNRQALDEERAEAKRLKEEEKKTYMARLFSRFKAVDDE